MTKKYLKLILLAASFSVQILGLAHAAGNESIDTAVNTGKTVSSIDNLIAGYGQNWKDKYLFVETPFKDKFLELAKIQTSGKLLPTDQTIYIFKASKSQDKEQFIVTPEIKGLNDEDFNSLQPAEQAIFFMLNASTDTVNKLTSSLINESCIADSVSSIFNVFSPQNRDNKICNPNFKSITSYNLNSLLGPIAYSDKDQSSAAKRFIQYASLLTIPFEMPTMEQLNEAKITGEKYLVFLRTYITVQSVGLSNLYQMYLARKPVTNLGKEAGMSKNDASPLEVEQFAATRRLNPAIKTSVVTFDGNGNKKTISKNWHESMEQASPAQVQREMVYLLAEMRHELYQQRLATERLTALMSVLQIEQAKQAMSIENMTLKAEFEQVKYSKENAGTE